MRMKQLKKLAFSVFLILTLLSVTACGDTTAPARFAADATAISWIPSVYYGNYGKISLLYETGVDEVSPQQDTNEAVQADADSDEAKTAEENGSVASTIHQKDIVSVSNAGKYAIVVSYENGTRDADAKPDALTGTGITDGEDSEKNPVSVTDDAKSGTIGRYACRVCTMTNTDGGAGKLYYGNTESGYFEVYSLLEAAASDLEAQHFSDILASVRFGQYTENDLIFDDNNTVYVQMND